MSFEEMQSILQGILLSQQQLQLSQQQFQSEMVDLKAIADRAIQSSDRAIQIAESNGRAIQAMLDNAATDRLDERERAQRHEERVRLHEEEMQQLKATNRGLLNLAVSIDEDRPTILRLLNSNNNKLDLLLDRLPPQQ
jgi:hypothetical protein